MVLVLPLIAALSLGSVDRSRTPWFLPRYAVAGAYGGTGVFAPTVRIGWEVALIEQKTEFVVMVELGPAFSLIQPRNMRLFWEHAALAGVGLRNQRGRRFHWGISAMAGPVLHGATFVDPALNEERWNGVVEGRAEAGADLGPVTLAGFIGYQQPWLVNFRILTSAYVGGLTFGVVVNWR